MSSFVARIAVELSDEGRSGAAVLRKILSMSISNRRVISIVNVYLVVTFDTLVGAEAIERHRAEI